jgi:hypothetical protein
MEVRGGKFFVPLLEPGKDYRLECAKLVEANRQLLAVIQARSRQKYASQRYIAALERDIGRLEEHLKQLD